MSESPLMIKSKAFALEVIRACKVLREAKCESALINQFLRSGTIIGANLRRKRIPCVFSQSPLPSPRSCDTIK